MISENLRMEILSQMPYKFFPPEWVAFTANKIKDRDKYIIFMDHSDLPIWQLKRNTIKKVFEWSVVEVIEHDIQVTLSDTGSIYVDIH